MSTKLDSPPSSIWPTIKLVVTLAILVGLFVVGRKAVAAFNDAVDQAKGELSKKGVKITSDGMSVKTDKRALTVEETEDRLQRSIMQGWKATTFQVPWLLQKTTNLGGSKHDKERKEWEKKHGPKPAKKVE
ncbi:hypothetical protein JCM10212_000873 [Sporobolomyces blumeae]